jgi:uncharacterized protein (TIGR02145 family)
MKKYYQLMILAVPLLFLVYICSVSAASGAAAYYVGPGEAYVATLDGRAREITNTTSNTLFIPVRTLAEQQSFLNNLPVGVAIWNGCGENYIDLRDSNIYPTVQIGNQCWMKKNLAYLPSVVGPGTGSATTPYYYVYDYNGTSVSAAKATTNYTTYGVLYNWPAANTACPTGWHLPTDAEFNILEKYVVSYINSPNLQFPCSTSETGHGRCADNNGAYSGTYGAGKSLKKVGIGYGAGVGDDLVGFSALLAGYRSTDGSFYYIGSSTSFWSSSASSSSNAWDRYLYASYSTVNRYSSNKAYGFSVRCLRDWTI